MSKADYPPEFESQVRKAMDVPEPNTNTMDALRNQFVAYGTTALKTDLQVDPASNPFRPEKDSTMKQKLHVYPRVLRHKLKENLI
jgi:hypothetical protein